MHRSEWGGEEKEKEKERDALTRKVLMKCKLLLFVVILSYYKTFSSHTTPYDITIYVTLDDSSFENDISNSGR